LRVLVTDGTFKHTLGIARSLGPRAEVYTASRRRMSMAGVSRSTHKNLRCPRVPDSPEQLRWLDETVARYGVEQIVPVGHASCRLLAQHRDRWPGTRIVLPPPETMDLALDKRAVGQLAASLGVPVPRTATPEALDEVEALAADVGLPLVIKGPIEGPSDVGYVDEASQVRSAYESYLERNRWSGSPLPMLQQRIAGDGYGVFATYQNGRCRRIMAHRRIREYPASGGASSCAELVSDPELLDLGRRLLDALAWHGVAMVEFKRHADGRYYLMEVNPKFWGSLDLALAAGCDFPGDLLAIGRGEDLPELEPPSGKLRFCWPLSGDLLHLRDRPGDWRAVLHDWVDRSVKTNIRPSDPLPHFVELAETIRALVRAGR
jgi:predicted ATP-grasp superfamily ATP-dependent carboligase